jgi:hypothetical protein
MPEWASGCQRASAWRQPASSAGCCCLGDTKACHLARCRHRSDHREAPGGRRYDFACPRSCTQRPRRHGGARRRVGRDAGLAAPRGDRGCLGAGPALPLWIGRFGIEVEHVFDAGNIFAVDLRNSSGSARRSNETAPAGELRPLIRTPDGGGVFQPSVPALDTAKHRRVQVS